MTVDGVYECLTLEDTDRYLEDGGQKQQDRTAIPRGTYQVVVDFSPHFQHNLPHVLNVPQFTGIRIHPGNVPADTDGCILVGLEAEEDKVLESRKAFDPLFAKIVAALNNGDDVTLEVA